ncbi:MAG: phosphatidylglycerophosphatase A [Endomicrobium sp.]|jgi:phosphatidylglycerophosphatase A|nr:phosphatidylglycerophosphatase A [Endomicrobium sp.]
MNKIILFFSSIAGLGYIKYASGTFGSLVGILLWELFIPDSCYIFQGFALLIVTIFAVLFSTLAENIYNKKDDRRIIIDEFAGMWISVAFLPKTFLFLFLGFVLFRILDTRKPLFIRKFHEMKNILSVTIDDVISAIFSNIVLQIIRFIIFN